MISDRLVHQVVLIDTYWNVNLKYSSKYVYVIMF